MRAEEGSTNKWRWPCPGNTRITSGVGPKWSTTHNGIDIAAPKGASVVATRSGVVTKVDKSNTDNYGKSSSDLDTAKDYGNYIYIDHGDKYESRYGHLTSVNVSVGDRVSVGQVIGTVGSTGKSTGFHLHFEIRYADTVVDPETLVVPGDSKFLSPKSNDAQSDIAIGTTQPTDTTGVTSTDTPVSVAGILPITSRYFTKGDPIYATFDLEIGGNRLAYSHGKPSTNIRLEVDKLVSAFPTMRFTIFDDNWDEIESYLSANYDDVCVQYGYSDGLQSTKYHMMLTNYSIDFNYTGTILNIEAMANAVSKNMALVDEYDTHTMNPTEAIMSICEYIGLHVDSSLFVTTNDVDRYSTYRLNEDNPITYIQTVIIPEAITPDGESVVFNVDADSAMTAHLYKKSDYSNLVDDSSDKNIRTYVYQKGYDSAVLDMSFDIKGLFGGTSNLGIATGAKASVFSPDSMIEYEAVENIGSVQTVSTGIYSSTIINQSIPRLSTSAETNGQMSNKVYYWIKNATAELYEAQMTILGDPSLEMMDTIRIINMTDFGFMHHTSGLYTVMGLTDTIENGEYRTTVKLMRSGDISQGIEILDPRSVVK